jgi:hypothetical protein
MTKIIRSTALLTLITAFVLGIGACKKDAAPAAKSKTELLTQSNWKQLKFEEKTGSGAWIENTTVPACEKDNNFIFGTTATYEQNEGATKCVPADPQVVESGTWSFQTNETQLLLTVTGSPIPTLVNLDQLDENTLIISVSFTSGVTTNYIRITLGH